MNSIFRYLKEARKKLKMQKQKTFKKMAKYLQSIENETKQRTKKRKPKGNIYADK